MNITWIRMGVLVTHCFLHIWLIKGEFLFFIVISFNRGCFFAVLYICFRDYWFYIFTTIICPIGSRFIVTIFWPYLFLAYHLSIVGWLVFRVSLFIYCVCWLIFRDSLAIAWRFSLFKGIGIRD
jgi:hypothetical protein